MRFCWIGCVLPLVLVFFGDSSAFPAAAGEKPLERNDTSNWYPFTFSLDDTNLDSIDLTGFLDAPAGKHGFLTVRDDGHFYFQDGTRARFFGTNVAGATAIPTREQAPILAARLAKYGVNMLRIHAIDGRWAGNFIDYKRGDTRHLSADMLDRLGFFIAELKKRGIYAYLDLLDYRRFQTADGVRDADQLQEGWQNSIKGASTFNERLIELQKEYAGQFLTYRNPHTGLRFVDDPAVAVVEITNENSVFYTHNTSLMLPSYADELRQQWNRWLVGKFVTREALATAWTNAQGQCTLLAAEDPAQGTVVLPMKHLYQDPAKAPFVGEQSPVRVNAMVRFFFELERRYYGRMREHLKSIGVKVPITGTNQTFCPASNYADAVHDFMSRNNYWLHPNVQAKPMFTFRNLPLVGSDLAATSNPIVEVASSAVAGKPMIVPEFNFPWPNEHRAECLPLMAAYACLQDWDGLLFYNYRPDRQSLEMFGSQSDPVRWGQFPAAALLFHRQDVSVARNTVPVRYNEEEIFTARPSHGRAKTSPYRHLAYLSKVRNVYAPQRPDAVPGVNFKLPAVPDTGYTSDTGELNLNSSRRLFTVRTARTKAAVGFLGQAGAIDLDGVVVQCRTPFAAIIVTSLDGRPIVQSRRLLVTAVARAENTGQAFDSDKSRVPRVGQLPVIAEPVDAEVELKLSEAATLYPLDETGKRRHGIPADSDQGTCRLRLAGLQSPWCEVEINPASGAKPREAAGRRVEPMEVGRAGDRIVITSWAGPTNERSEREKSEGFVSLFDGRSLDGWQGSSEHWIAGSGTLTYKPPEAGQNKSRLDLELLSERQYADFVLRFEFKLDPGSNNGVAIRTPLEGDPAFVGMEIQVIDTEGWTRGKLKPFQVHGSIYGVVPARTGHLKPTGEWNEEEIVCHGRRVKVTLNGAVIVEANLDEVRPIDGSEHPGLQREKGHLGFLGHTGSVAFRHIRLQDLSAGAPLKTPSRPQAHWRDTQRTAPPGTRVCTFPSRTVGQDVSYVLYLPPDYETDSQRRYPVLYWLHGRGGTQYTGADFVVPYLDAAIRQREAPAMIAILVNGLVDGFYSDSPDGRFPLESVIIKDLLPHVDATYRTIAQRQARAVQGYSMGGWGAAHLGFTYPDLFGAVCIDAGALLEPQALRERHPDIFDRAFGTVDNYLANHPRTLIEKNVDQVRGRTFIRIGVGDKDQLLGVNQEYHELLVTLGIEHEYEVVPGVAHFNRDYHRVLGAKGFAFYGKAFAALEP